MCILSASSLEAALCPESHYAVLRHTEWKIKVIHHKPCCNKNILDVLKKKKITNTHRLIIHLICLHPDSSADTGAELSEIDARLQALQEYMRDLDTGHWQNTTWAASLATRGNVPCTAWSSGRLFAFTRHRLRRNTWSFKHERCVCVHVRDWTSF